MKKTFHLLSILGRYLVENRHSDYIHPEIRIQWAQEILQTLNFKVTTTGNILQSQPAIFVSNHIGYIDIPLLVSLIDDCVFLSKKEVASWPILGQASKKIGTLFVERSSKNSRVQARQEIMRQLSQNNKKVIIFPSGTTSLTGESHWSKGIFEVAEHLQIPLQPVRIIYSHLRTTAYVDKDRLLPHLVKLTRQKGLSAFVEFHTPMKIKNVVKDLEYCRTWCTGTQNSVDLWSQVGNNNESCSQDVKA